MGNNSSAPTTSNHGNKLRKSQSVPDTQKLSPDAQVLFNKEKSLSQQKLSGKPGKFGGKKQKHAAEDLPHIPPAEALFLPEFPLRGDLDELEFEVIDVIAKGAFGNVIKVQREDQKRFYAMKVLDKGQIINEGAIRQCKDEAAIQSLVGDHTFIVKAHEYWQSRTSLYIVLDYVPHGDMFTLWTFHGAFPEALVQLYIAEICLVIDYLHNSSVIYRDIKMENILFDPKGHIQVTDFGLAKFLQGGDQTRTVCGTLQYMAPEVLSVYPYGHAADWWSVGILMYAMLAGKYPVDGADTHTKMAQKVFECEYLLPSHISDLAQDVINRFLTKSPHKRLSDIYVIQDLYFFQDIVFSDLLDRKLNPVDVVPEDFFPMTGESWAPQVLTPEEQQHFDQFDDSNETITDEQDHHPYHQPYQKPASYNKQPLIPRAETAPDQQENSQTLPYNQPNSSHYSNQQPQQFGHQQSRESVYNDQQRGSRSFDSEQCSVSDRQSVNSSFDYRQNIALASAGNFTRQNGSMVGSMHQSSGLVRSGSFTQQGSGMGPSGSFTQQGNGMGSSSSFTQQGSGMGPSGSFTQQGSGMGPSGSFTQQGNGMGSSGSFTQQGSGMGPSGNFTQGSGMGSSGSFTQQNSGLESSSFTQQGNGMGSSSSFTQQGSGMVSSGSFTQQGNGMVSSGNFTQGSGMGSSSSFTQQGSGMVSSGSFTQQGSGMTSSGSFKQGNGMGSSSSFTQQNSGLASSGSFTQHGSGMGSSGSFTQQNNVDTQRRQSTDHSNATRSSTYMYGETIPERRASTTDRRVSIHNSSGGSGSGPNAVSAPTNNLTMQAVNGYGGPYGSVNATNTNYQRVEAPPPVRLRAQSNPVAVYNRQTSAQPPASTMGGNYSTGSRGVSLEYKTVEAPPVITLPPQTAYNHSAYNQHPAMVNSASSSSLADNNYRPLEDARLNFPSQVNKSQERPPVPMKPPVAQKPTVPVKPSFKPQTSIHQQPTAYARQLPVAPGWQQPPIAPVKPQQPVAPVKPQPAAAIRPQPAPRKSISKQNSVPYVSQTSTNNQPLTNKSMYSQGLQNNNTNFYPTNYSQDLSAAVSLLNDNLSKRSSYDQRAVTQPADRSFGYKDQSQSNLGNSGVYQDHSQSNLSNSIGYQDNSPSNLDSNHINSSYLTTESQMMSPNAVTDNFKWNLPADATPSFV